MPAHRMLAGRYRLDRVIGSGAMGIVWAAYDEVLHRAVAIKEINYPQGMPVAEVEQLADRTLREARAIAAMSNPHVITLYDILTLDSGPVIVMELLTARSLAQVLRQDGPLRDGQAATVGVAVAGGLLAAHGAGITHRDVKPGNVLIGHDGRIKLTDFGIARSADEQTITAKGLLLGSPAYIAPEVAAGQPAGGQADAWGLGALLFAAVQGRPPYDRGDPIATLTAVVSEPVPPHPQSGRVTGIIDALLVKDPRGRLPLLRAYQALQVVADDPTGMRLGGMRPPPAASTPSGSMPSVGTGSSSLPPGPVASIPQSGGYQLVPARPNVPTVPPAVAPGVPAVRPFQQTVPPPPWGAADAAALSSLPAKAEPDARRRILVIAVVIAVLAAAIGFFLVRAVADWTGAWPASADAGGPADPCVPSTALQLPSCA
jgi:serine/threonine protein kinase